jgi:hypothetical protein
MAALRKLQERALSSPADPDLYSEQEKKITLLEAEMAKYQRACETWEGNHQRLMAAFEEMKARAEKAEAALALAAEDEEAFVGHGADGAPALFVNLNDTFGYACADCEEVPQEEVIALFDLYQREGWPALIRWAATRQRQTPIKEMTESMDKWDALRTQAKLAEAAWDMAEQKLAEALLAQTWIEAKNRRLRAALTALALFHRPDGDCWCTTPTVHSPGCRQAKEALMP